MKKITRTIKTSFIYLAEVKYNEETDTLSSEPLTTLRVDNTEVNKDKALKLAKKEYGKDKNIIVSNIVTEEHTYALDVETFMELAHII